MSRLLKERLEYFSAVIEANKIVLSTAIEPDIVIDIDQEDAVRLLDNLVSNAIKYNWTGGSMEISMTSEHFRIKDNGVGIAREELATIHERFKRANSSEGGFGIGLDIVYQLIESYGFGITIDSKQIRERR